MKGLFGSLKVPFALHELDQMEDGKAVQASLEELTGRRTVPNVFVGGKSIGGCDDVFALMEQGSLVPMLEQAQK